MERWDKNLNKLMETYCREVETSWRKVVVNKVEVEWRMVYKLKGVKI